MADYLEKMRNLLAMIKDRKLYRFPKSDNKELEKALEPTTQIKPKTMMQKIVIQLSMNGQKSRTKAMEIVSRVPGAKSITLLGQEKNRMEVVGVNMDAVALTTLLRKKMGHADLVSVTPAKAGDDKKEDAKKNEATVPIPLWGYDYPYPYGYGPGGPPPPPKKDPPPAPPKDPPPAPPTCIPLASSSHWPIDLPDGQQILQHDSLELITNAVAHGARADQSYPVESRSEKKMMRKTIKQKCRTMSGISLGNLKQNLARKCEDAGKSLVKRIYRQRGIYRVSKVKRILWQHGIHRWPFRQVTHKNKWAAMKGSSLGEERSFENSGLCVDEKLDSRLRTIPLLDGGNIVGPIALSLREVGGRLADAAKSLGDIYDPGFQTPDSLARKSLEALETLSCQEQPSDIIYSLSEGRLTLKGCARQGKLPDPLLGTLQIYAVEERVTQLPRSLGGLTPQSASSSHWPIGLPDGQQIMQLDSIEQSRDNVEHGTRADQKCPTISLAEKKIFRKSLKRKCRTTSGICLEDLQQHYGITCEYAAKSNCVNISAVKPICTPLRIHRVSTVKRIRRQHGIHRWPSRLSASTSHWPISLPYRGRQFMQLDSVEQSRKSVAHGARVHQSCPTASLSEKKMVRRTLKRRCRTTSVISLDELQQHFGSRCEDAVKCLFVSVSTVKYICRQHGIHKVSTVKRTCTQHWFHRWPFRQKCATKKGCYLGEERSVEVISLSTADGGEIVGPIALSSSNFASTNNKARLVREDQRGSTASHSEKKNTREASNSEGISTSLFSLEDLQRLFGSKREDAANILGVSVSTFKRICRHHEIKRWPNRIRNNVWKPPDPQGEKNVSPTCKTLSANGQTATWYEMVGHLQESNEFPPDFIGGSNCWNAGNDSLEDILRATTFHDSCPNNYLDMGSSIPTMFKESGEAMGSYEWAFQLRDQSTVSTSYLNPNAPVVPQHQKASTQMVSDNMRISEDWRQPQIPSTQLVSENMGISEDWRQHQIASKQMVSENMEILEDCRNFFAPPTDAFMEGLVSGSSNWTLPTCSNPTLSQTKTTIPHLMPYLPASQDLRSVTLKATYGDTMIRFQLPLTSGIAELKEEVSLRLKLELGSFDVEYKDEDGDWILIGCDKDLRDYLRLFSSFGNQVIRLLVIDRVPKATNFSGSCGLKGKRP